MEQIKDLSKTTTQHLRNYHPPFAVKAMQAGEAYGKSLPIHKKRRCMMYASDFIHLWAMGNEL